MSTPMENSQVTPELLEAARQFLAEAEPLCQEMDPEADRAVREAAESPLDTERARRLYTRVLQLLRDGSVSDGDTIAEQIRTEVESLVGGTARPEGAEQDHGDGIQLVPRYGLSPRAVAPIPEFLGRSVPMEEGFIDVERLPLWEDNHRIELYVREFEERHHRRPEQEELLMLLTGATAVAHKTDPFNVRPLARSIARKGVERPPILTHEGVPKDGNRRIASAKYVLESDEFDDAAKERARWIRVWKAAPGTTDDQFEAIVVACNFEEEHKEPWPEYVKARLVEDAYQTRREGFKGQFSDKRNREIKQEVAKQFAIKPNDVTRYLRMVRWAQDFEDFHIEERNRDAAGVRYRANDIFQWFYEIDAGRGSEKLTRRLDEDDELKTAVYDLMFDVIDSGALVRNLHRVAGDEQTAQMLHEAHEIGAENPEDALDRVKSAVDEAKQRRNRKMGLEPHLKTLKTSLEKLGAAGPEKWKQFETDFLRDLRQVFTVTLSAIDSELWRRDEGKEEEEQ